MKNEIDIVFNIDYKNELEIHQLYEDVPKYIEYIEVKNMDEFKRLIINLKDDVKCFIWLHPSFSAKRVENGYPSKVVTECIPELEAFGIEFTQITRSTGKLKEKGYYDVDKMLDYKKEKKHYIAKELKGIIQGVSVIKTLKQTKSSQISSENKVNKIENFDNVDIVIICAIDDELKYVLELIPDHEKIQETFLYHFGELINKDKNVKNSKIRIVAAKQDSMGMVDCSFLASRAIKKFNPKYLIMTGVCGGRKSRGVKIGDVIIPKLIYTYQKGKLTNNGLETRPEIEKTTIDLNQVINNDTCKIDIPSKIAAEWNKKNSPHRLNPTVWFDPMACGDLIVNKSEYIEEIVKVSGQSELAGVDMESYSILRASNVFRDANITPIVIKAVMDFTEEKSDKDKNYAAFVSAKYLFYLATEVLDMKK